MGIFSLDENLVGSSEPKTHLQDYESTNFGLMKFVATNSLTPNTSGRGGKDPPDVHR